MTLSRRTFVTGGLTVLAGSAVASRAVATGQIDPATPEVAPGASSVPLGATIASVAAELGYDQAKILAFVTDEIAYEPYAGALRGANGTLWGRAGNSVDKATLLGALLQESLITYRFAFGAVPDAAVPRLEALARPTADAVWNRALTALSVSARRRDSGGSDAAATPAVSPGTLDELRVRGEAIVTDATAAMQQHLDVIGTALDDAGIVIDAAASPIPARETDQHAWIQVADGPAWIDLDPTFGEPVAEATLTSPRLGADDTSPMLEGDDLRHTVAVRLVAEEVTGGGLRERRLVALEGVAGAFVTRQFGIAALPPEGFDGLGLAIDKRFTGNVTLLPMIVGGDITILADRPIVFGGGSGDVLSAAPGGTPVPRDGETTALVLEIDVTDPDQGTRSYRRTLFDRLGETRDRAEGPDLTTLAAVETVPFYGEQTTVRGLDRAHILTIASASLPFLAYFDDAIGRAALGPFADLLPVAHSLRDGFRTGIELDAGQTSFMDGANVTLATVAPADAESIRLSLDLIHRPARTVMLADAAEADPLAAVMRTGILDQVAEAQALTAQRAEAEEGAIAPPVTVPAIFTAAIDAGIAIVALRTAEELAAIDAGAFAPATLEARIADGQVVILPERPVELAGERRTGAWIVDTRSGVTRDLLDDGSGGIAVTVRTGPHYSSSTERGILAKIADAAAQAYKALGKNKEFCIFVLAGTILAAFAYGYNGAKATQTGAIEDVMAAAAAGAGAGAGYAGGVPAACAA